MTQLIHQTWQSTDLPARLLPYVKAWKRLHPGWSHQLWTDEDNAKLIQDCYPWFLATYQAYPYDIQRADAIRYFILHRYGGLYADLDYQPFAPFDFLSAKSKATFIRRRDGMASNFLMYAGEGRGVWESLIQSLTSRHQAADYRHGEFPQTVLQTTGPGFLAQVLATCKSRRQVGFFDWAQYDPYDRFACRVSAAQVRRLLSKRKAAPTGKELCVEAPEAPLALERLLANCKGIHWRVGTWLQARPCRE